MHSILDHTRYEEKTRGAGTAKVCRAAQPQCLGRMVMLMLFSSVASLGDCRQLRMVWDVMTNGAQWSGSMCL